MGSFATIRRDEIRTDCRFYTGYKPCGKHDGCPDCPHYAPRGGQVLVIKLGAMGDVLRTKAILPALRRRHPDAWLVWLTAPGSEPLVRDPLVDEIRPLTLEGVLALEGRTYSHLYSLDKDAHAVSLAARFNAGRRYGFAPTPYNTIDVWNEASMHALRLGLSDDLKFRQNTKTVPEIVAEMCELDDSGGRYTLTLGEEARAAARAHWTRATAPLAGRRILGLNTGCGPVFATKGWTEENMAGLIRMVGERDDVGLALLGGPRETGLHARLLAEAGPHAQNAVVDMGTHHPLEVFFGLVEQCDVLLTADTLALHVALALGRPVVAWFGPTCHQEIDLFGLGEKLVTDFPCSPCYLKSCPKPVFCLSALAPETVLAAADRVLTSAAS